jgi:glycosidase
MADFDRFLEAAHGGMGDLDLVVSHTSDQHPGSGGGEFPYRDYYVWSDTDGAIATPGSSSTPSVNWTWGLMAKTTGTASSTTSRTSFDNPR